MRVLLRSIGRRDLAAAARAEETTNLVCRASGLAHRTRAVAIAFTTGVTLAITAAGHAQSTSAAWRFSELAPLQRAVNDQRILLDGADGATRQGRPLDRYLQNLYDEILRRAGASDAR